MSDRNNTKDTNEGWQRWQMADLGVAKASKPSPAGHLGKRLAAQPAKAAPDAAADNLQPIPDDVLSQVAEIGKTVRETAHKEGYADGLKKGHAKGFAEGKAQAQKIGHDEGYQAGHREGYEKGLAEGRSISGAEVQRLQDVLGNAASSVKALDAQISDALVDLALNIARQVIRSTLTVHPEKIIDTVRDILQTEASNGVTMYLRLHPEDLALVRRHLADDPRLHMWHLEPDEHIERGGCMAETSLGDIDATLKTRWDRIAGTLRENPGWLNEP